MKSPLPLIVSFIISLLFSLGANAQLKGDSYAQAKQSKSAKFYYVFDGVPGFVDKDSNGNVTGFLADIMREFEKFVEKKDGIKVVSEWVQVPNKDFAVFMSEVRNGTGAVFGLSNVSIKEERKEFYQFSPAYINNVSVLITNSKVPKLSNLSNIGSEFSGMTAYSVHSSTYYERLSEIKSNHFASMKIESLSSVNEVLKKIEESDKAFGVLDLNYYLQEVKEGKIKRHAVGDKGQDKFGVLMPLSSDWEPLIADFFDSGYIGGSEYRKLITEHLGKSALRLIEGVN